MRMPRTAVACSRAHAAPRLPVLGCLLVVVGGCGESPSNGSPTGWSLTDSAGVGIVEQTLDQTRVIRLDEVWRTGSLDGAEETQFFTPRDAVLGDDGRVYVLDSGNDRVKVFDDADGTFLHAFGSAGDGPGEFQITAQRMTVADGLLVVIDAGRRIHAFRTDGTHVNTLTPGTVLPQGTFVGLPVFDGERWMFDLNRYFDVEAGEMIPTQPTALHFVNLETGEIGDSVGLAWEGGVERESVGSMRWSVTPLFEQDHVAWLDDRGRLHRVFSDDYAWRVWAPDGRLLRRVENHDVRVPVAPADLDRYEADRVQGCRERPNSECESFIEEALPAILDQPLPEFKPTIYQFDGTADGDLLVLRADLGRDIIDGFQSKSYDLFAPDGRFRGRFTMPASFRVIAMDQERILAIEKDQLDVEQLVLYRWSEPVPAG